METFKYNPEVKYKTGASYHLKTFDFSQLKVYVNQVDSFSVATLNPLRQYLNPDIRNDDIVNRWMTNPLSFYQNQLNLAVWLATTGCGISYSNHLHHSDPLIQTVYRFHFYYQVRKILSELKCPLKHEKSHDTFNNPIDLKAYERLCNEFGISTKNDFRQNMDRNKGMGSLFLYAVGNPYDGSYVKGITSFNTRSRVPLLYIKQKHSNAWTGFILDTSQGFTRAGVERLNDSIRTFVWCVLSAQAETRSNIVKVSSRFDTQKQFLSNLEDAIDSRESIPNAIDRYQNYLRYARSKVDFCVGVSLYMIPSDLQLQIGTITNYNNNIVIATTDMSLGINEHINQKVNVVQSSHPNDDEVVHTVQTETTTTDSHEQNKELLTIGLVSIGLCLWYFKT